MGYSRKNPNGRLRIYFFENPPGIFHLFTLPWKFQIKQNSTPGYSTKTPRNSTSFLINPWKFHMLFLWYPWKFHILNPPNINWLSEKVWDVHIMEKNVYCPSLYTFPIQYFLYFLEGQVHKDSKLGIMTNVGKSRPAKVIFTSIPKVSDACANSFDRYIMTAQCMRNVFTFY